MRKKLTTSGFVEVYINPVAKQVILAVENTGWVNSVLVGDYLPEFRTNLVAALTSLNVNNFPHDVKMCRLWM